MSWLAAASIRFRIRAAKARFRDQRAELDFIRRHLNKSDLVCDIGANKGAFIYWLSRWAGNVVAFEPQAEYADLLAIACRDVRLSNVKVEAKAVYSHSGDLDFFIPLKHRPGASIRHQEDCIAARVSAVSLDDYFEEDTKIRLLKIDVEGAELPVLKGAERLLRIHAPLIIFECERRHVEPGVMEDTFAYLTALGYEGRFVCRGQIVPISRFDAAVHQSQIGEWFWKEKDYCNNFIFTHSRCAGS